MKTFTNNSVLFLLAMLVLLTAACSPRAQKVSDIKEVLESKSYVFVAESATPMSGRTRQLTSEYRLIVNKDSLDSHLPYFGTAYKAPFGSSTSPLSFTSSDFTYSIQEVKNGRYEIAIKLNTPDDPDLINLSVSANGYATLRVSSMNRQSISFYGYVKKRETKTK